VAQQYTVHRLEISPLLKVLNAFVRVCGWLGMPFGKLDPMAVVSAARRRTGLHDMGDPEYLDVLERLFIEADAARCTAMGEVALRQTAFTALVNRLETQAYLNRFPGALQVPIEKPVFIVGFPRTGTTLLQNLLCLEEGARALEFWELIRPVPQHEDPEEDHRIRYKGAERMLKLAKWVAPEMPIVHDTRPDSKEECWYLFVNSFAVMNMDLASGLSRFGDWLMQRDMSTTYREYRETLQMMAHWKPTRQYVLKCPEHLWFLDTLLETFPDACIVWTHRDPATCVASYSSMISLTRRAWFGRIYAGHIGLHIADRFREGIDRALAVREQLGPERFFDVNFTDLVKDPVSKVRDIRAHFDLPHSEDSERAMRDWMDRPRTDRPGKHIYSPAQWGLEASVVRERYADYIERFGVTIPNA